MLIQNDTILYVIGHITIKRRNLMAKKQFDIQGDVKRSLGDLICRLRKAKDLSLRQFAKAIGLPPSNVTYIEKGVNVPSPEVYSNIIKVLIPPDKEHQKMDMYYCSIRNIPPPDVCEILLNTPELRDKLRLLENVQLSSNQLELIGALFATFKSR